jgi:LuxR family maltose regulon positive regulatory protein
MTKVHPPPEREQTVRRERLVERLRPRPGIKLTVVAAPAGYGKTTLLGGWREAEETARPVAWLTIDEGDNDPVVLWSYVLASLRRVCPALGVEASPERVGSGRLVDLFLPELVNALTSVGEAALVLDDFHHLSSGLARESVAWFIEHDPSTFQLVLGTRSEPGLPLAALRAHGALLELRADELGFTPAEADMLLNDRLELGLERQYVDDLVERTEGWPAGLYLAALSLQGVEDRHLLVSRFGGGNRHVVDFLVDEVLEAHDPAMQALMLHSSILDRLCGSLCDALLEGEGAGAQLDALSRTNLFLVPLDDHGQWYRFHQLFAQLLRVELEHREPGLAATLHRRASAWHRSNGSIDAAIEHALDAGAFAEAGEMISTTWTHYVHVSRHATVFAWLERFPRDLLRDDLQLLLVEAWLLSLCGKRVAAVDAIAAVERSGGLEAGPLPDGFSSLEASLATLRGTITWGDVGAGLQNARRAAELEGPESPWRAVVCSALGECLYFSGEFEEADRWLKESAEIAPRNDQWWVASTSLAYRSLIAGDQGRIDEQTILAAHAVKLADELGLEEAEGEASVALGASLAARGNLEKALTVLERAVKMLRSPGHPRNVVNALIHQAGVLRALDRREAAAAAIDEAKATVAVCPDPRILAERLDVLERSPDAAPLGKATLSERELVVLRMLGGRLSERDIGRELYLSHNTIHSHTRSIYRKLCVSSRKQAVERALELGVL